MKEQKNYTAAARAAHDLKNIICKSLQNNTPRVVDLLHARSGGLLTTIISKEVTPRIISLARLASIRYWDDDVRNLARKGSNSFIGCKIPPEWVAQSPVIDFNVPQYVDKKIAIKTWETPDGLSAGVLILPLSLSNGVVESALRLHIIREAWGFSLSFEGVVMTDRVVEEGNFNLADVCADEAFLRQHIVETEREYPHEKHQKRLQRQGKDYHVPEIHRVVLRRVSAGEAPEPTQTDREYSCRWLVRGHWRQQYHPSTKERKPKFITPYIKGDPAKPLRIAQTTVTEVRR